MHLFRKAVHGRFDIILPAPVVGLCGLAGIIAVSIAGCFAYYPEPAEAIEELRVASIESSTAAISGEPELCLHWLPICEGWNKRLIVGMYLRKWAVPEDILALSNAVRKRDRGTRTHVPTSHTFHQQLRRQATCR